MSGIAVRCGVLLAASLGMGVGEFAPPRLGVTVDLSERRLEVKADGKLIGRYRVSVGETQYRTPTGSYHLSKVIWNPSWVPPDTKWAENKDPKRPSEPGNPMGRVKIYFAPELYIHGTSATGTLGEPVSHGCIRMSNPDAMRLARLVMDYGGARKPPSWFSRVRRESKQSFEVEIPRPVALEVRP